MNEKARRWLSSGYEGVHRPQRTTHRDPAPHIPFSEPLYNQIDRALILVVMIGFCAGVLLFLVV